MPILNYTTKVNPIKTISEITQCLVERNANKIVVDYEKSLPISLTFQLHHNNIPLLFSLPANFEGVLNALKKQNVPKKLQTKEQAIRVSWRILKVWIEAQMAIIDSEMVTPAEVFLPYAITKSGKTVYQEINTISLLKIN